MTRKMHEWVAACLRLDWRHGVIGIWFLSFLLVLLISPSALAAVGRTAGNFDVTANGAATYSIPIFTPPGPRGIQPAISLVYNSNYGNGYMGRGWSLSGLSSITRCAKNVAQDGVARPVSLHATNPYCINGNRLRVQSGTYGEPGSVYATEVADFSRITLNGSAPAALYWTIEGKDGLTYTYGGTVGSRPVAILNPYSSGITEWFLSDISDRSGNAVRFTWDSASATAHPVKIEWTKTSSGSGSYAHSMDFTYGSNAAASIRSRYFAGVQMYDEALLTGITVSDSGVVWRNYVLTYDTSPSTSVKRLTQVKECSDIAANDCLSATNISYQNGTAGVNVASPAISLSGNITEANGDYDFNGDGIKDLAYNLNGSWHIQMGSISGGYGAATNTGHASLRAGRILGDHADQLLGESGGTWYVYAWNGASFVATSTGITTATMSANVVVSDVDGDGRDDLFYTSGVSTYQAPPLFALPITYPGVSVNVRLNLTTAGSPSFAPPVTTVLAMLSTPGIGSIPAVPPGATSMNLTLLSYTVSTGGDLNGDGDQELALHSTIQYCYQPITCGSFTNHRSIDFLPDWQATSVSGSSPAGATAHVGSKDLNGDGCDDYIFPTTGQVGISDCNGQVAATFPATVSVDWDSDGRKDFITGSSPWDIQVSPFYGTSVGPAVSTGLSFFTGCYQMSTTDGNGDGQDDLICVIPGSSLTVYLHNGTNSSPDLATAFEDGFGITYAPTYTTIERGSYSAYFNAVYPYRDARADRRVVSEATISDGTGGTYTKAYTYFGAQVNLQGRGFSGFERIEAVDSRNGVKHVRRFERAFPYSGMLIEESLYQPGGLLMSSRSVTAWHQVLDATPFNQRYHRYISESVEDQYEVGGSRNGDWISRTETSNAYDTWGNLISQSTTVTDKDYASSLYGKSWTISSTSSFAPSTAYWCLDLPYSSVTTNSTTTGEATVTRITALVPDHVNCRMTSESVEPSNVHRRVDTSFGYDVFGNVSLRSVTGYNPNGTSMPARTSTTSWGVTGQFPVSETNALSQTTTRTFHSTFGGLLTETDPNGIVVTNNEYDSFGRLSRSIRSDGTATRLTYADCATYGCQSGDPASGATSINKTIIIASERDTSDAQVRDSRVYLDQLDREIVRLERSASGGYSRSGTQYNALGQVYRRTAPCDASTCTAYWFTNTYDLAGRVLTQSRPQNQSISIPVTTTYSYAGRQQSVIDPNGKVETKVLDANGWMRRSIDHDGYYQSFSYDAAGSLKAITDSLSNTLFSANYSYGIRALQDSASDVDLGERSYTYNSLGELISWSDAKGQLFSQVYDPLSRVTSRTEPEGTTHWTWGATAGSFNIGRIASVSMSGYVESFIYDNKGRLSSHNISTDQGYSIDYAYTTQGLLDTLTYPISTSSTRLKVKYGYAHGVLQNVTDWTSGSAGTVYWAANAHNARGQAIQETLGNGVITNRSFDAVTGWLNSMQSGVGGGAGLQNHSYLHDFVGNVTQRQENTLGLTENFYYDNLYRLDYSTLNGVTNLDLTYDPMGNITNRSDVNGNATWTYHPIRKHAVTSTGSGGVSYGYDDNGNMTSRDGAAITWSSYNYPTGLVAGSESTVFHYGPGRQYYRQDYSGPGGSETTHYVAGLLEKVFNGSATDWRHYVVAQGNIVAIASRQSSGANAVNYPLKDLQGSVSVVADSGGTQVVRQSYNAFGQPRDGSDWNGGVSAGDFGAINGVSRRGYTGHSMLGAMGLIHMNGRVQDANIGRFISPDPNVPHPGNTQSYNRYSYVRNNPLTLVDPSGFEDTCQYDTPEHCGDPFQYYLALRHHISIHCRIIGCQQAYSLLSRFDQYSGDWMGSRNFSAIQGASAQYAQSHGGYASRVSVGPLETGRAAQNMGSPQGVMGSALAAAGIAAVADGPVPIGDAVGATILVGAGAYVVADRVAAGVGQIVESTRTWAQRPGEVYTLRAQHSGEYPNLRTGGTMHLNAGEIWKIGESLNGAQRYSGSFYRALGVDYQTEFVGGQLQMKIVEKQMLGGYVLGNGHLPPGNRIFR